MLSFHKRKNYFFQILLLFILINVIICAFEYNKEIDDKCSVNLQCKSGCCQKDKCVETKKCKKFRDIIYIVVAIVGVVLAAIFTVYLLINLCIIKKDFMKKAEEKSRNEANKANKQKNN